MDRDHLMLDKLLSIAKKTNIKNPYKQDYNITKKTDMWFVMIPQWSQYLPPFNIARLSSVLLEDGFYTRCLDLNIKAWNLVKDKFDEMGFDPWYGTQAHKWKGDVYFKELHHFFEILFENAIEAIVKANPKVIGFTLYWTNTTPTVWFKNKLKERLPNTIFIAGGPSSQSSANFMKNEFDITVIGESEKIIVETLNKIENKQIQKSDFPLVLTQPSNERLNLNMYPIPNFSDFDTNEYLIPNGTISEFSRGCVAKCTFCEETHFWNFRQRGYLSLVDELEHLNKHYGIEGVWFVDSLVNGSLKELEEFAKEVIRRELKIQWFGYARHDKRMDLEYLKTLAKAGCISFQFGSESGSNKVLEDMKKRITKEDMEQNFIDCEKVGISAVTGWVIGFPTETINDFIDTMTLVWRNRNTSITNLVVSQRFHLGAQTIVGQNPDRFEIFPFNYVGCFIRNDFTLGKPHLLIRSKTWSIFQEELVSKKPIGRQKRPNLKKHHYELTYDNPKIQNNIEFEDFDYNIIKTDNIWMDSCLNQPFGFLRFLWRTRGGFQIRIKFEKDMDYKEFGPSLTSDLNGYFDFKINHIGEWECDINLTFIQPTYQPFTQFPDEYFFNPNNATLRARKFAKPSWGQDGISKEEYTVIADKVTEYNKSLNLSFNYKNKIKGDWAIKKENKNLF